MAIDKPSSQFNNMNGHIEIDKKTLSRMHLLVPLNMCRRLCSFLNIGSLSGRWANLLRFCLGPTVEMSARGRMPNIFVC